MNIWINSFGPSYVHSNIFGYYWKCWKFNSIINGHYRHAWTSELIVLGHRLCIQTFLDITGNIESSIQSLFTIIDMHEHLN